MCLLQTPEITPSGLGAYGALSLVVTISSSLLLQYAPCRPYHIEICFYPRKFLLGFVFLAGVFTFLNFARKHRDPSTLGSFAIK